MDVHKFIDILHARERNKGGVRHLCM